MIAEAKPPLDPSLDRVLDRIRAELQRQVRLQREGRFDLACSDPKQRDGDNLVICLEECLEAALSVLRLLQRKDESPEHLEEEILQSAATFAGWLIARDRRSRVEQAEDV